MFDQSYEQIGKYINCGHLLKFVYWRGLKSKQYRSESAQASKNPSNLFNLTNYRNYLNYSKLPEISMLDGSMGPINFKCKIHKSLSSWLLVKQILFLSMTWCRYHRLILALCHSIEVVSILRWFIRKLPRASNKKVWDYINGFIGIVLAGNFLSEGEQFLEHEINFDINC